MITIEFTEREARALMSIANLMCEVLDPVAAELDMGPEDRALPMAAMKLELGLVVEGCDV